MIVLKIRQKHLEGIIDGTKEFERRTFQSLIEKGILKINWCDINIGFGSAINVEGSYIGREIYLESVETGKRIKVEIVNILFLYIENEELEELQKLYKKRNLESEDIVSLKLKEIKEIEEDLENIEEEIESTEKGIIANMEAVRIWKEINIIRETNEYNMYTDIAIISMKLDITKKQYEEIVDKVYFRTLTEDQTLIRIKKILGDDNNDDEYEIN